MAISTKRRGEKEQPQVRDHDDDNAIPNSIFDALEDHPLGKTPAEVRVDNERKEDNSQPNVADLLKQIAEMKQELDSIGNTNNALLTAAPQVLEPEVPKAINFDGLPDPVVDPKGYAEGLEQRITARQNQQRDYENQQNRVQQTRKEKFDTLWSDFSDKYADIAADQKGLEFAAQQVANEARSRGVDLDRYMFGSRDRFMAAVAKEYEEVFGPSEEVDEEAEEAPRPRGRPRKGSKRVVARRQLGNDDDDDGRTGGIFGGQESGGARTGSKDKPQAGDMVSDLQELQRKSGFF